MNSDGIEYHDIESPGDEATETLVAAVADCFILSFRAIASASHLNWADLECAVDGMLDKADGGLRFTGFVVRAKLTIPSEDDRAKAEKLLQKAEHACLITNSLLAESNLSTEVVISQ